MGGGDGGADEVFAGGDSGGDGHDGEHPAVEEVLPEAVGAFLAAEDDGHGGGLAIPSVELEVVQDLFVAAGVVPQALQVLRLGDEQVERGFGGIGLGGGERGAENRLLRMGAQVLDDIMRAGDKTARAGERLGQATGNEVE